MNARKWRAESRPWNTQRIKNSMIPFKTSPLLFRLAVALMVVGLGVGVFRFMDARAKAASVSPGLSATLSVASLSRESATLMVSNHSDFPLVFRYFAPQPAGGDWPNDAKFIGLVGRVPKRGTNAFMLPLPQKPEKWRFRVVYQRAPTRWKQLNFELLRYKRWVPLRLDLGSEDPPFGIAEVVVDSVN